MSISSAASTMSKASQPELKKVGTIDCIQTLELTDSPRQQFMDKRLFVNLQGGRKVSGTLRGYDLFLNLVLDDAQEETTPAQRHPIGTVVGGISLLLGFSRSQLNFSCRLFGATT